MAFPRRFNSIVGMRDEAAKKKRADEATVPEERRRWWEPSNWRWNWTAIATCVIAGATIVAVVVAILQWRTLGGQLDEMAAERRPWVSVDPEIGAVTWENGSVRFAVRYELKNTGRSPALDVDLNSNRFLQLQSHPIAWILKNLKESKTYTGRHLGFPLFPGGVVKIAQNYTIKSDKIEQYRAYLRTFKHKESDPDQPPIPDWAFSIPIAIGYIVDYASDDLHEPRHQSFCWASVNRVDPLRPLGPSLALQFNEPVPAAQVRLDLASMGACGAN